MSKNNKINFYLKNGLISQSQADAILEFEKRTSKNNKPLIKTLYLIASVLIGMGIIALVATNWQNIPDFLKLLADFTIWGLLIWGLYRNNDKENPNIKNFLSSFAFFYVAATLGLIHQIFHLSYGSSACFLLVWTLLSLPFMIPNRFLVLNLLWSTLFLHGIFGIEFFKEFFYSLFRDNQSIIFSLFGYFFALLSIIFYKISNKVIKITLIPISISILFFLEMYGFFYASIITDSRGFIFFVTFLLNIISFIFIGYILNYLGKHILVKLHYVACVVFIFIAYGHYIGFSLISFSIISILSFAFSKFANEIFAIELFPKIFSNFLYLLSFFSIFISIIISHQHIIPLAFLTGIAFFSLVIFINNLEGKDSSTKFHSIACMLFIFIAYGMYIGFSLISFSIMAIATGIGILVLIKALNKRKLLKKDN